MGEVISVDFKTKKRIPEPKSENTETVVVKYDFTDAYSGVDYHFDRSIKGVCPDHVPIPFFVKDQQEPVTLVFTLESLELMTQDMLKVLKDNI